MKRSVFLGASASGVAFGSTNARAELPSTIPGGTHFVEAKADFDEALFERTIGRPADIRQLFEAISFHPPMFGNVRNAMNGLTFGFGYAPERVALAICPHGPSSSYCFSDYVWQKYKIGEAFKLKDAQGNSVVTNVYLKPDHALNDSTDPSYEEKFLSRHVDRDASKAWCDATSVWTVGAPSDELYCSGLRDNPKRRVNCKYNGQ